MSAGPIRAERDAHKPKTFSTPANRRVCAEQSGRAYCGRSSERRVVVWAKVSCNDCRAAHNADSRREVLELIAVR